ncbi:MAG: LON peptidase substrate-binding domain-containing protein [Sandaracinus sp.]
MIPPETPLLTDDELAELPVFPLPSAVLFPGVSMGLHLFEPRYRAMMRHCLEKGPRAIAIAQLKPGFEKDYEGRPAICEVAGAGRIVSHRGNPDGTFDLILEGTQRVRLHELPFVPPFRRARAETIADVVGDEVAWRVLADRMRAMLERLPRASSTPIPPPRVTGSSGRVLDLIADALVRDPARRQALLEATTLEERWTLLSQEPAMQLREAHDRERWRNSN